ncbi:MAG: hypothetical protein OXQ94_04890 [Gemmatimonadota bacterium]|nr:hypothetical protein [Gemmatimonadota bacterium]MDE2871011.1 hypothetical protein [Gemmatimonadota bacterium]
MRAKAVLLQMVAVAGWGTVPSALGGQDGAVGEEIVAALAAALDSPAPRLSTIGIIDGTWERIAVPEMAAAIGRGLSEPPTPTACSGATPPPRSTPVPVSFSLLPTATATQVERGPRSTVWSNLLEVFPTR